MVAIAACCIVDCTGRRAEGNAGYSVASAKRASAACARRCRRWKASRACRVGAASALATTGARLASPSSTPPTWLRARSPGGTTRCRMRCTSSRASVGGASCSRRALDRREGAHHVRRSQSGVGDHLPRLAVVVGAVQSAVARFDQRPDTAGCAAGSSAPRPFRSGRTARTGPGRCRATCSSCARRTRTGSRRPGCAPAAAGRPT